MNLHKGEGLYEATSKTIGRQLGFKDPKGFTALLHFFVGVFAIGVRMLTRKRQKVFATKDVFMLIAHIGMVLGFCYTDFILGFDHTVNLVGRAKGFMIVYILLVILGCIYHYVVDFVIQREGLEHHERYRGKSIFHKKHDSVRLQENANSLLRLLDSVLIAIIAYAIYSTAGGIPLGMFLGICAFFLLVEEFLFKEEIIKLERNENHGKALAHYLSGGDSNSGQNTSNIDFDPKI